MACKRGSRFERALQKSLYKMGLVSSECPLRGKAKRELEQAYKQGDLSQKSLYVALKAGRALGRGAKRLVKSRKAKKHRRTKKHHSKRR